MTPNESLHPGFVPLRLAASELGVPMQWLRAEADAGRLPCLRIRHRYLFDLPTLRAALLDRIREELREGPDFEVRGRG